jgi:Zn-finger nucleic acid-binding protein
MHTICPNCATRISNRAKYCHSCAAPIAPQAIAGDETELACPACSEDRVLHSRPLGEHAVSILECHDCAGIWIGHEVFQLLEEKALDREIGWNPLRKSAEDHAEEFKLHQTGSALYRRCPDCSELMNRTNYSRRSGVIVDICPGHGIWFDHGELARILRWIRDGNWTRSKRQQILEDAEMTAARKAAASLPRGTGSMSPYSAGPTTFGRFISMVIETLVR